MYTYSREEKKKEIKNNNNIISIGFIVLFRPNLIVVDRVIVRCRRCRLVLPVLICIKEKEKQQQYQTTMTTSNKKKKNNNNIQSIGIIVLFCQNAIIEIRSTVVQ